MVQRSPFFSKGLYVRKHCPFKPPSGKAEYYRYASNRKYRFTVKVNWFNE